MHCDVLVIGAGPAGSALASQLAQAGFDVRLADKKAFPRDKPCGEFLSPQCLPYLDELGVGAEVSALGPRLVRGMRLSGYGQKAEGLFRRLAGQPEELRHGLGIRRERFDALLVDAAVRSGATWLPRHDFVSERRAADGRITGALLRDAGGALVECSARWTVGADGVHSRIAKAMGVQRRTPWLDQFALVAHFAGVSPLPTAEVHLFPGGFFAATTVDDGIFSVNLLLPRKWLHDRRTTDWDTFVQENAAALAPDFAARLAGKQRTTPWRGIGPFAHTTTAQTFPGLALTGDACGYVDPLTGEGIYFALFAARALGTALTEVLHGTRGEEAAMAGYRAARRREIGPRLAASTALQRLLRHPWIVRAFLRKAGNWPLLADLVVTLSGDTIHPRDLLRPSFWRRFRSASA
jgi:flavin-dependent dehydrogenase